MGEPLLLYLAFGSLAGLMSGLFGIGGGVVIVPFLAWYFPRQSFPGDLVMVMAVATSLATIAVTSVAAAFAHERLGAVRWEVVRRLAPGVVLGSVLGSLVADRLPVPWFKLVFSLFLLFVAGRMAFGHTSIPGRFQTPRPYRLDGAGFMIGVLSSILGIGGGTLSVPFLLKCRFPLRNAVAISSACGFPIAFAGCAMYVTLGWQSPLLPEYSLGYIYLPAFLGIILGSVALAPLGARLAHRVPTPQLKRVLALVLFAIGLRLLWQSGALLMVGV